MEDTERDEGTDDGMSFTELMKHAASIRTQQDAIHRRKFDSFPSWYQATLGSDEEVARIRLLPFDDRVAQAFELKAIGNKQVQEMHFDDAIHSYTRCLSIFRWIENTLPDWRRKVIVYCTMHLMSVAH